MKWKNRIVGYGTEAPDQLLANPKNWRIHPHEQQAPLQGVLEEVGWVQSVIVNRQTGFVVDGHLRVALALRDGQQEIPVVYVDITEAEESEIMATLDPIGAMAATDRVALDNLIAEVQTSHEDVQRLLDNLRSVSPEGVAGEHDLEDMELRAFEGYDYIVMIFRNQLDWIRAVDLFQLKRVKAMTTVDVVKLGLGRVIEGTKVLGMLADANSNPVP